MRTYLTLKIAALSEKLQGIDRDRLVVAAELRAYEDMLEHLESDEPDTVGTGNSKGVQQAKFLPSAFEMSKDWLNVMERLCGRAESFRAGDMVSVAGDIGFATKLDNARSQLAFYEKKKYVRRVARGLYSITAEGKAVFQKTEAPVVSPTSAPKVTGEVSASPKSN